MIVADQPNTVLCYLNVADYTKILKESDAKILNQKISFINKYLIHNIQYNTLKKICLFYKSVKLKYGQYVFNEGEKLENIYMVFNGEISLKKIDLDRYKEKTQNLEVVKTGFFQSMVKKNKMYHPVMFKVCQGGHLALDSVFSTNKYEYSA